jgi:membrane protein implicated in regulation of membrane protease activity
VREFIVYTLLRLGLFVATWVLVIGGYAVVSGEDSLSRLLGWPFLIALVVSSIASVYLLRVPRQRFAAVVERRAAAASRRFESARSKEDEPER